MRKGTAEDSPPMAPEKAFGQVLKEIRRERGISQEELGFESGFHRTYISLLERGQKSPSLNTVFQLAMALQISPSDMIQRVEAWMDQMCGREQREREKSP